jgi:phosphatidylserine synthase
MTIETNFMRCWAGIVESAALFAITILATGVMVSAVKFSDLGKHLGTILCIVILLLMLPAIIVSVWSSMSFWQQLGIIILGVMIGLSLRALRQARNKR